MFEVLTSSYQNPTSGCFKHGFFIRKWVSKTCASIVAARNGRSNRKLILKSWAIGHHVLNMVTNLRLKILRHCASHFQLAKKQPHASLFSVMFRLSVQGSTCFRSFPTFSGLIFHSCHLMSVHPRVSSEKIWPENAQHFKLS